MNDGRCHITSYFYHNLIRKMQIIIKKRKKEKPTVPRKTFLHFQFGMYALVARDTSTAGVGTDPNPKHSAAVLLGCARHSLPVPSVDRNNLLPSPSSLFAIFFSARKGGEGEPSTQDRTSHAAAVNFIIVPEKICFKINFLTTLMQLIFTR